MCNYCKQEGHVIADFPTLARQGRSRGGGATRGTSHPGAAYATTAPVADSASSLTWADVRRLVHEALKEALTTTLTSAFATGTVSSTTPWHVDSASYNHMTGSRQSFRTLDISVPCLDLQAANGSLMSVEGVGHIVRPSISLPDTLYVPKLVPNLVSVGQLAEDGCRITFDKIRCVIQDTMMGQEIGRGTKKGRSFLLDSYSRSGLPEVRRHERRLDLGAGQQGANGDSVFSFSRDNIVSSVKLSDWDLWHF
ncbi:unnamed protein product [Linum trigynum]|uniref:Retrovirus-related Pol polyprotein from transposon TNT 1-94-like beta-barrel domain-containing protein n=1 Tax=Linum trigynum TaxID=586398 RepID=A0AAV2DSL6_9ROSI